MGLARPFRMAKTPAIVVVLTAPRPTSSTPSLPRAGAMSIDGGTGMNYISLVDGWSFGGGHWAVVIGRSRGVRLTTNGHVESVRQKRQRASARRGDGRNKDGRTFRADRLRARRASRRRGRESRLVGSRGRDCPG